MGTINETSRNPRGIQTPKKLSQIKNCPFQPNRCKMVLMLQIYLSTFAKWGFESRLKKLPKLDYIFSIYKLNYYFIPDCKWFLVQYTAGASGRQEGVLSGKLILCVCLFLYLISGNQKPWDCQAVSGQRDS